MTFEVNSWGDCENNKIDLGFNCLICCCVVSNVGVVVKGDSSSNSTATTTIDEANNILLDDSAVHLGDLLLAVVVGIDFIVAIFAIFCRNNAPRESGLLTPGVLIRQYSTVLL